MTSSVGEVSGLRPQGETGRKVRDGSGKVKEKVEELCQKVELKPDESSEVERGVVEDEGPVDQLEPLVQ